MTPIISVSGRGLPLLGDDLDTDRIMPARFLRAVTFDSLEQHVFEDDRLANPEHAFNNARYAGASVLVVNRNFGCGSSREHAPQGLVRYGVRAIVGESFSEIFLGNSAVLGLPCLVGDADKIRQLQTLIEGAPDTVVEANIEEETVHAANLQFKATLPAALRDAFISGQWNPTAMLLARFEEVKNVAERLPYVSGF